MLTENQEKCPVKTLVNQAVNKLVAVHGLGGPKKAQVSQRLSHVSFALLEENNQRLKNAVPKIHYIIH